MLSYKENGGMGGWFLDAIDTRERRIFNGVFWRFLLDHTYIFMDVEHDDMFWRSLCKSSYSIS